MTNIPMTQTTWLDQLRQITALCCFSSSSFSFSSSFFLSPSSSNVAKSSVGSKQELTWSDVSVHIRFIASGVFFIYIFFILFYYLSLFFFHLFFLCYLLIFAVFGQTVPVNSWHRKSRSHGNGFTACPHPWCQHWGHYAVGIMYAGLHGKWGPFLFSQRLCVCVCERNVVLLSTLHMASSESDSLTCFSPFFLFSFGPWTEGGKIRWDNIRGPLWAVRSKAMPMCLNGSLQAMWLLSWEPGCGYGELVRWLTWVLECSVLMPFRFYLRGMGWGRLESCEYPSGFTSVCLCWWSGKKAHGKGILKGNKSGWW